ncbi:MAG: ankyrin repeat domain-containing protein [Rubripirellula sp.]
MSAAIKISDPDFRRAVALIDEGDAEALRDWIEAHPTLMTASADEDGSSCGSYFANPRLLWFVAENPTRNGVLTSKIVPVAQTLIDLAQQFAADDLDEQLNYTLALVSSSLVAQKCNQQRPMIQTLVAAGADPNSGIKSALAHRETDACEAMLHGGAKLTLALAAGLGLTADVTRLSKESNKSDLQEALAIAAINTQPGCIEILLDRGAAVNQFNPDGVHAHSTPLHQAVYAGCAETVDVLLSHGADVSIKDKVFHSDCIEWARHQGHHELATRLSS